MKGGRVELEKYDINCKWRTLLRKRSGLRREGGGCFYHQNTLFCPCLPCKLKVIRIFLRRAGDHMNGRRW